MESAHKPQVALIKNKSHLKPINIIRAPDTTASDAATANKMVAAILIPGTFAFGEGARHETSVPPRLMTHSSNTDSTRAGSNASGDTITMLDSLAKSSNRGSKWTDTSP